MQIVRLLWGKSTHDVLKQILLVQIHIKLNETKKTSVLSKLKSDVFSNNHK